MPQYEEAVKLWQSWNIQSEADLSLRLDSFRILFAYHSGKIETTRSTTMTPVRFLKTEKSSTTPAAPGRSLSSKTKRLATSCCGLKFSPKSLFPSPCSGPSIGL